MKDHILLCITLTTYCCTLNAQYGTIEKQSHVDAHHQPTVIYTHKSPQKICIATQVIKNPTHTGWRVIDYLLVLWGPTESYSCRQINTNAHFSGKQQYLSYFNHYPVKEEAIDGDDAKQKFQQLEHEFNTSEQGE